MKIGMLKVSNGYRYGNEFALLHRIRRQKSLEKAVKKSGMDMVDVFLRSRNFIIIPV
jgi:molybdenum-dependent DNA-binding transcriptional regulator ModE